MIMPTADSPTHAVDTFHYDNAIVRQFGLAALAWGLVAFLVGLIVALKLVFPNLLPDIPYLSYGRLRPLHTNAAIFAFAGNAIFVGVYYSLQRLCKARMFSDRPAEGGAGGVDPGVEGRQRCPAQQQRGAGHVHEHVHEARSVTDVHEHGHGKPVRRVRPRQHLDADVEVDRTFFERVHLGLEGEIAQLHVVDGVTGHRHTRQQQFAKRH